MVFVAGPRQVGKTTLAKSLPGGQRAISTGTSRSIANASSGASCPRRSCGSSTNCTSTAAGGTISKGCSTADPLGQQILVTGSAPTRLLPLWRRFAPGPLPPASPASAVGGGAGPRKPRRAAGPPDPRRFPEPYFSGSETEARRWSREHRTLLVREEVASARTRAGSRQSRTADAAPAGFVGSPLSINALREDLQVAHKTVANWLQILERLYAIFRLSPFGAPRIRAVKKEQKHYHWDWSLVPEPSLRFENLVAGHLLKWVASRTGCQGPRPRTPLLPRYRPPRGGLRRRRGPGAAALGRMQVGATPRSIADSDT